MTKPSTIGLTSPVAPLGSASSSTYDPTASPPLTGPTVQDAIDQLQVEIDALTGGTEGMVPYYIAPAETFTVPLYKQALFEMTIDNEGILDVVGFLVMVD